MSSIQQRAELQAQIWKIANDVRGSVDGWDFKQFVLGSLFYRFISENFSIYIEAGDDSVNYAALKDSVITPEIKDDAVKTKGYFIYPSQLFSNVTKNDHIPRIMEAFDTKTDIDHFAKSIDSDAIAKNDYNISVSSYVVADDTREVINITKLNAELKTTAVKIDKLRTDIDAIVAKIEGGAQ